MSKNKITVLLVEDEQTLAMIIKDTLEENDFIIHTANDGEEGLSLFFDHFRHPSCIFLLLLFRSSTLSGHIRYPDSH